jgi:hypothetical protein
MIYAHVLNQGGRGVCSRLDFLRTKTEPLISIRSEIAPHVHGYRDQDICSCVSQVVRATE